MDYYIVAIKNRKLFITDMENVFILLFEKKQGAEQNIYIIYNTLSPLEAIRLPHHGSSSHSSLWLGNLESATPSQGYFKMYNQWFGIM